MKKIVNCPNCPIFWEFIDNFFLLYCDLYGCGLSYVYSSATSVGVCLPKISDIVYVLAIWNMMTYSGCEMCFLYTVCKDLLVPMKLSIYDWHYNILGIQIWFTYIWLWKLWSVMHFPTFNVNCDYICWLFFFNKGLKS